MSKNETENYIVKGAKTIMDTKYPSFNFVVENLIVYFGESCQGFRRMPAT